MGNVHIEPLGDGGYTVGLTTSEGMTGAEPKWSRRWYWHYDSARWRWEWQLQVTLRTAATSQSSGFTAFADALSTGAAGFAEQAHTWSSAEQAHTWSSSVQEQAHTWSPAEQARSVAEKRAGSHEQPPKAERKGAGSHEQPPRVSVVNSSAAFGGEQWYAASCFAAFEDGHGLGTSSASGGEQSKASKSKRRRRRRQGKRARQARQATQHANLDLP